MRYEKPQKGRLREFFQFNVDILGEDNEMADLEVISVAIDSLCRLGLTSADFVVKINNRNFVNEFFNELAIESTMGGSLYKIIDNARKVENDVTWSQIEELGVNEDRKNAIKKYLQLSSYEDLKKLKGSNPGARSLLRLFSLIKTAGFKDFCEFDPTIVRGLDYYTGAVFEIFDRSEEMRAICGGGRYNNLLKEFSGVEIPACGFGMGDVVLGEILMNKGLFPPYRKQVDYFLVRISEDELGLMLKIARSLRARDFNVEYTYKLLPVKKQMSRAAKIPAKNVIILGSEEISRGKLIEKDLSTGEEREVDIQSFLV
jgi:histidyl-tRNA synthetase